MIFNISKFKLTIIIKHNNYNTNNNYTCLCVYIYPIKVVLVQLKFHKNIIFTMKIYDTFLN